MSLRSAFCPRKTRKTHNISVRCIKLTVGRAARAKGVKHHEEMHFKPGRSRARHGLRLKMKALFYISSNISEPFVFFVDDMIFLK